MAFKGWEEDKDMFEDHNNEHVPFSQAFPQSNNTHDKDDYLTPENEIDYNPLSQSDVLHFRSITPVSSPHKPTWKGRDAKRQEEKETTPQKLRFQRNFERKFPTYFSPSPSPSPPMSPVRSLPKKSVDGSPLHFSANQLGQFDITSPNPPSSPTPSSTLGGDSQSTPLGAHSLYRSISRGNKRVPLFSPSKPEKKTKNLEDDDYTRGRRKNSLNVNVNSAQQKRMVLIDDGEKALLDLYYQDLNSRTPITIDYVSWIDPFKRH